MCDYTIGSYFLLLTKSNGFSHPQGSVLCPQFVPGANYPFFTPGIWDPISPLLQLVSCIPAGSALTWAGVGSIYWFNAPSITSTSNRTFCFQVANGNLGLNLCLQRFGVGGLLCARPNTSVQSFFTTFTQVATSTSLTLVGSSTSTSIQTLAFLVGSTSTSVFVEGTVETFTQTRNILTFVTSTISDVSVTSVTTTVTLSTLEIVTASTTLQETTYFTLTSVVTQRTTTTKTTKTTTCPFL